MCKLHQLVLWPNLWCVNPCTWTPALSMSDAMWPNLPMVATSSRSGRRKSQATHTGGNTWTTITKRTVTLQPNVVKRYELKKQHCRSGRVGACVYLSFVTLMSIDSIATSHDCQPTCDAFGTFLVAPCDVCLKRSNAIETSKGRPA